MHLGDRVHWENNRRKTMRYDLYLNGRWVGFQFAASESEAIDKYAFGCTATDGYTAIRVF
ncbi:hypothetical protein [Pseudomonas gingeri]|uniref:hypothetical protein n=1 Tax=Pseudomonas gingeri TaxID=117681 RepID=UPI00159F898B|nr:hypothetical protein [Pseudomonas gingeri]NWA03745.1 hypothetical protein [Pseudomonas gingeri]NWA14604.1 hypothetical protein [Pseudomonas gingeri]NWA54778.1 hypothetical protein [Pseudomonas gingeri]NWA94502.1 hypothetical protein [Pseudomonas gingeri]NWB01158.1 hypothetical protein [Pseudomonas gingeri]